MAAKKTTGTATRKAPKAKAPAKAPLPRSTLASVMRELEQAGSEQTRKTYKRHGAEGPMFGVSFATLKALVKRIGVDHELALALWTTDNFDARNLALKIADPARMSPKDLDRWASESRQSACGGYVAMLAGEGPHAAAMLQRWLAAAGETQRTAGWILLGQLACRDEALPDAFFADALARIERTIHAAPNRERQSMHDALIQIGGRSAALRKAATAAAKRIGDPEIDHGDTDCKTRDAAEYIAKAWTHSTSKGFASPAAHERTRETLRTRC